MAHLAFPQNMARRRGGFLLLPFALLFALALFAVTFVTYALWPTWPGASAPLDAPTLPITIEGVLFEVPPAAIRAAVQRHPGPHERIDLAFLFDPMMAVHTSNVEALPHQISAVYEEMLKRQPLRFLLADDPGAGKTIMAGLYIKELMLRGDLERRLIVVPANLAEQWQDELLDKFRLKFDIIGRSEIEQAAEILGASRWRIKSRSLRALTQPVSAL